MGIENEVAAFFKAVNEVILANIGLVMAGNIIRLVNEVGRTDFSLAKTKVGNGNTARLLRVIGEIALCVKVCLVTDDFNSALVGAYGTVGAQTPELAADSALVLCDNTGTGGKGEMGYIVYNTDCKIITGLV